MSLSVSDHAPGRIHVRHTNEKINVRKLAPLVPLISACNREVIWPRESVDALVGEFIGNFCLLIFFFSFLMGVLIDVLDELRWRVFDNDVSMTIKLLGCLTIAAFFIVISFIIIFLSSSGCNENVFKMHLRMPLSNYYTHRVTAIGHIKVICMDVTLGNTVRS